LNAEPVNISQVMRKTVIDGSNTSGFQRTMLIAKNGFVKVDGEKITIPAIFLEEDAAKIVSKDKDETVFRLDRLGIPLIEISTAPEIKNKEQAKEIALKIGDILRACKVKRGIGTIRQDVNLSIRNGARTEIKGVQEPSLIPKTIEKEIERQQELLKKKKKIEATVRYALETGESRYTNSLKVMVLLDAEKRTVKIDEPEWEFVRFAPPKAVQNAFLRESLVDAAAWIRKEHGRRVERVVLPGSERSLSYAIALRILKERSAQAPRIR
jgi:Glu-tRNA(Gln) amidotransferase subunit E-like FAD-binding protein